jgi:hypothetical protein
MRSILFRLMLPLILLAQVAVGMSPGRVLCIGWSGCGGVAHHDHGHGHDHGHDHADHHADHHAHHSADGHADAVRCAAEVDPDAGCTCHTHVSTPDEGSASRDRAGDRLLDVRLFAPLFAALLPAVLEIHAGGLLEPPRLHAAHWPRTDQCCARAVTRLLI